MQGAWHQYSRCQCNPVLSRIPVIVCIHSQYATNFPHQEYEEHQLLSNGLIFDIYVGRKFVSKCQYDRDTRDLVPVPFLDTARVRIMREQFPEVCVGTHALRGRWVDWVACAGSRQHVQSSDASVENMLC
mgnify:FL=1